MSTREIALNIVGKMSDKQLRAFIDLFGDPFDHIEEEEPDEFDKFLIEDGAKDNDESMDLDEYVRRSGFDPNDLQV